MKVCWCLQTIGSSKLSRSDRVQRLVMLVVAESRTHWFVRGDGVVVVLVKNLLSVLDLFALEFCVFWFWIYFQILNKSLLFRVRVVIKDLGESLILGNRFYVHRTPSFAGS